ncbi:hypothetical protein GNX71_12640 [Variovorax sp. RKNM96]|uniref:hypothetical protein n=1 Tax=Variovorax sp. RKNM96 TaxID=2681552 RepID=UPI0019809B00|nr:hypothetical protein [Variovorax sp. RKNM96]QSI30388.1 hypothetical protein GNX71_12640 [Variovorax sp. RKNM96]
MTTANPPAPSAQVLFFSPSPSRRHPMQPRQRAGRISTWPFRVVREHGHGDDSNEMDDIRVQAARVIRTTAEHWWPSET